MIDYQKIKNDIAFGKQAEQTVKPLLEKLFGELKFNHDTHNFDFSNDKYYVEHKQRNISFGRYDSLIFDKVKYNKYLELKQENPKLQFFVVWSLQDDIYMWKINENSEEFYIRDKYDVDLKRWRSDKKTVCVLNNYIGKFSDFEVVIKKKKKNKTKN
tara:strand:+ start:2588 stop:3058 length:471 start_codon:yes stop_codon:yes gene_type:complete